MTKTKPRFWRPPRWLAPAPQNLSKLFWAFSCLSCLLFVITVIKFDFSLGFIRPPIPPLIHLAWVGLKPFSPIALATIDSITRHQPKAHVKVHMPVEEGLPHHVYLARRKVVLSQIHFFRSKGLNIEAVFYETVNSLVGGTVLENVGIRQRHIGGLYNTPTERAHASHVSDIIREVVVYKEGGSYMDADCIQLKDMGPLVEMWSPMYITTDEAGFVLSKEDPGRHLLNVGVFAAIPNHPFIASVLLHVRKLIEDKGADCWFPWAIGLDQECGWNDVGPKAFTVVHQEWCANKTNPLPLVVNSGDIIRGSSPTFLQHVPELPPYVVVSPALVSPLHWSDGVYFEAENATVAMKPDRLTHFAEKVLQLAEAYQIHVFKPHKDQWLEMLENPLTYPLVQYVHHFSCNHFCKVDDFRKFLEVNVWAAK